MVSAGSPADGAADPWATFRADAFAGRSALVTGGTSGIGRAIATALGRAGAAVTATGATAAEVDGVLTDPAFAGIRAVRLDVRDAGGVEALVGSLDRLDLVVNCAGVIRRAAELDPDVFAAVVDVNLTGTMRVCAAARAALAASRSSIVNTASMLSFFGAGLAPGYAASKGGVAQLTKSLALAYAADGIRVNAIAPGWIETPLTSALRDDPARRTAIAERTPMKRWGRPDELVGAALFLASPAANFVTGVILPVDGGYLAA